MDLIRLVEQDYMKDDIPKFNVGDIVKVHIKIKEGNRERIQIFEGFVLKRQNGGMGETFTVRRIALIWENTQATIADTWCLKTISN
jgi:large subunit ribosomal protein L19